MKLRNILASLLITGAALAPQARAVSFDVMCEQYRAWRQDPFIACGARFTNGHTVHLVGKLFGTTAGALQVQLNGTTVPFILHNQNHIEAEVPQGMSGIVKARVVRNQAVSNDEAVSLDLTVADGAALLLRGEHSKLLWHLEAFSEDRTSHLEACYTVGMHNLMVEKAFNLP